jgi:hypothetical protein
MSGTGLINLQPAEYARLTGDVGFMALATGVFDAAPENQPEPFVTTGEATEIPWRTFGTNGHEITRTFHIYDRDGATFAGVTPTGSKRAITILNALITLLEGTPLTVDGHTVVDYCYEFGQVMREVDDAGGVYRHIPARFRATLEDAA